MVWSIRLQDVVPYGNGDVLEKKIQGIVDDVHTLLFSTVEAGTIGNEGRSVKVGIS